MKTIKALVDNDQPRTAEDMLRWLDEAEDRLRAVSASPNKARAVTEATVLMAAASVNAAAVGAAELAKAIRPDEYVPIISPAEALARLARCRAALADPPDEPQGDNADRPVGGNAFRWNNKLHEGLSPLPWRLVNHLWFAKERRAAFSDLAKPVWRDREVKDDNVKAAQKKANGFFSKQGIPIEVSISNGYVVLKIMK